MYVTPAHTISVNACADRHDPVYTRMPALLRNAEWWADRTNHVSRTTRGAFDRVSGRFNTDPSRSVFEDL